MRCPGLLIALLVVTAASLSMETFGGLCSPNGGFGYRNHETWVAGGGFSQSITYLLDIEINGSYSRGNAFAFDFTEDADLEEPYEITKAAIGINGHNFFGSRNPYLAMGLGYYNAKDIFLNPGNNERLGAYVALGVRGQIGGNKSPCDFEFRAEENIIPNIRNRYLYYYYPDQYTIPHKTETRIVYARNVSYVNLTLGFRFKFL